MFLGFTSLLISILLAPVIVSNIILIKRDEDCLLPNNQIFGIVYPQFRVILPTESL